MEAYIGGVTSVSLADLEMPCLVVYFAGCDFKCQYCDVKEYLDFKEEYLIDLRVVKRIIDENLQFIKGVLFTGGEPCLQRQALLALARYAKHKGLFVAVETNGAKPETIKSLVLDGCIDRLCVDIKAPLEQPIYNVVTNSETFFRSAKRLLETLSHVLKLLEEIQNDVDIELRTTIVPNFMNKKEDIIKIADAIKYLKCRWVLKPYMFRGNIVHPVLYGVHSPSKDFMKSLRDACRSRWPGLNVNIYKPTAYVSDVSFA